MQQRLKGVVVLNDERVANVSSGEGMGQLCQLQTSLQRPGWVISDDGQSVDAIAKASVEWSGAWPLLRVEAWVQVTAPAVRPGPWRILLGVPSVPRDKCQ